MEIKQTIIAIGDAVANAEITPDVESTLIAARDVIIRQADVIDKLSGSIAELFDAVGGVR